MPIRFLLFLVVNLLLAPWNLVRALRRRPRWVTVRLDGAVPERPPRHRFPFRRARMPTVAALRALAEKAKRDRALVGVVLQIDQLHAGWARLESLRGVVAELRAAGKRVVAHLSSPGNRELYLACACDEILVDESGPVALTGLAAEVGFYGDALRRLGVDPELMHVGDYKSFSDTFTRGDMSPAHREALDAILDGIAGRLVAAIAESRRVDAARARALVDGGPYLVQDALASKLVDGVCYRDELPARLGARREQMGSLARYLKGPRWLRLLRRRMVAVVTLEGAIVSGEGGDFPQRTLGGDSAARTIAALADQPRVAAVVLHVDSRGGSSAASDRIWREVARLAERKPVVAYFDDVAASGGYYLAAACSAIVAQPSTLTGSIGVVTGKFSLERLLARFAVGTALVTRGRAAAMNSFRRSYDDEERARLRAEMMGVYHQFVGRVAAGRKLPVEEVERIAQGRVWLGADAHARKLVDRLGGLADAVADAEARARRRPGERFLVHDVHLRRERVAPLRALTGPVSADALAALVWPWRERVLALATDLPEIG